MKFSKAVRAFEGHLIGSGKSVHTVACYRSDLGTFREFLEGIGLRDAELSKVTEKDLGRFGEWLKSRGFINNTRRRKLLTIRKMFAFFYRRNKLNLDVASLAAPHKIERVPTTLDILALRSVVLGIRGDTPQSLRTRVVLLVLIETGCLASELPRILADALKAEGLEIPGKRARTVPVSRELRESFEDLVAITVGRALFSGFNRFGPLPGVLTPRGLEVLLKSVSEAPPIRTLLRDGQHLTPRLIRHSVAVGWLKEGMDRAEVQKRLGLATPYAFRAYEPLLAKGVVALE